MPWWWLCWWWWFFFQTLLSIYPRSQLVKIQTVLDSECLVVIDNNKRIWFRMMTKDDRTWAIMVDRDTSGGGKAENPRKSLGIPTCLQARSILKEGRKKLKKNGFFERACRHAHFPKTRMMKIHQFFKAKPAIPFILKAKTDEGKHRFFVARTEDI